MCTQLFNMKHTQQKQGTHTHRHTHTRIQTAYWSRVRRREVVGGPIRTRRQTHCCSSKSRACQATTYPCPCAFDLCSPHHHLSVPPQSSLTLQMYLSVCVSISAVCIFALSPPCRRVEVHLNGRRLIPDLFLSASIFRLLFLNSLYDPLFLFLICRACASAEINKSNSP